MKKVKLLPGILLVVTSAIVSGQKVCTLANLSENIMYAGIENPIGISVSEIPNNHLRIIASDSLCRIEKVNDNVYLITPLNSGALNLMVLNMENDTQEVIGSYPFRVKLVPMPDIFIAGQKGGKIFKSLIFAMPYILAESPGFFTYDAKYRVNSFNITFTTDTDQSFSSNSNRLMAEQLDVIAEMEAGQSFFLSDIVIQAPEGNRVLQDTIVYTIK